MKTRLSPEESQRLRAIGVSADKASGEEGIYTLDDLLALLPKEIEILHLHIPVKARLRITADSASWYAAYVYDFDGKEYRKDQFFDTELADVLHSLARWCINTLHVKL